MSLWKLARESLAFYRRTGLGVVLAAVVSTAVLTGALVVGDSVNYSLRRMVDMRLGRTQLAVIPQNRFFTSALADRLASELNTQVAPILQLRGLSTSGDGREHANRVAVLGVDRRFFDVGRSDNPFDSNWTDGIVINEPLAEKLAVKIGDEVVLRVAKPSVMPRDVPLTPDSDMSVASRLVVREILTEDGFGLFNLQANQVAPFNAFVPLQWLQQQAEQPERANMLLAATPDGGALTTEGANTAIEKNWKLGDANLQLNTLPDGQLEIRSSRVFIEERLAEAALNAGENARGILTYFVNELKIGDRATPYSTVAALGGDGGGIIPADMSDDEIVINEWLAGDTGAKAGDRLTMKYFVIGPTRKLIEKQSSFTIRSVIPITGPAADKSLMPDYPGLADVDNCRDWQPGIPIDLDLIHDEDEQYWDQYRGTPKAFVTLDAGQSMWGNRYGKLTMVRYDKSGPDGEQIASDVLEAVDPARVGLFFQPVRDRGMKASRQGTDFGQLFLGLSMFLIAAALVLMALIFVFGIERRTQQVGMLLAVGLRPGRIKRLLMLEGAILACAGVLLGTFAALGYTRAMIFGLATLWSSAVAGSAIYFHYEYATLIIGALATLAISLFAMYLTLRKQASRPARELLAGQLEWQFFVTKKIPSGRIGLIIAAIGLTLAAVLISTAGSGSSSAVAGAFFGAGASLLLAAIGLAHAVLSRIARGRHKPMQSLAGLGLRNSTRRKGRSLAVFGLLACGVFLIVSVGANRQNPMADADERDSGTGGFQFYAESAVSILHDLSSKQGREAMDLDDSELQDVKIVQMRLHEGDDASCFNLNRAQKPALLGVNPAQLAQRNAFSFAAAPQQKDKEPWLALSDTNDSDVIGAVADQATVMWALGKKVGDELDYVDEKGRPFKVRLVGTLKNSIMQGRLIIDESRFKQRFPSEDGYRVFLLDAPDKKAADAAEELAAALQDYGFYMTPTIERLAAFNSVQNTYLSIFQMLGGLGLILGSIGLGLVVLRNVLDRRGELAMLRAVGFEKATLKRMLLHEHWELLAGGIAAGVISAVIAVMPALGSPGAEVPYIPLLITVAAIAVSGIMWIWLATTLALSGRMIDALRNE